MMHVSIQSILVLLCFPLLLTAQVEGAAEDSLLGGALMADSSNLETVMEEEAYAMAPYTPPPLEPIVWREVRKDDWEKAAQGLDYSKDLPKPPKAQKPRESAPNPGFDWTGMTQGLGTMLQLLAVILALGILAYGIYWMMQTPRNRTLSRDGTEITLANLDEYIHETDLDRFLRDALAASDWPLAVRLYFLQAIKHLSEKEAIVWSKEKTNRDYIREMRSHHLGSQFRDITRQYEQVWYGNQALTSEAFALLEPEFKMFLAEL